MNRNDALHTINSALIADTDENSDANWGKPFPSTSIHNSIVKYTKNGDVECVEVTFGTGENSRKFRISTL